MNHRIFERTLRSLVFRGACLFECLEIINPLRFLIGVALEFGGLLPQGGSPRMRRLDLRVGLDWALYHLRSTEASPTSVRPRPLPVEWRSKNLLCNLTSNQVGLPAELKHINKRRKRN